MNIIQKVSTLNATLNTAGSLFRGVNTSIKLTLMAFFGSMLVSCDSDSDSSVPASAAVDTTTQVQALASMNSRRLRLNIQSGSGLHASTGTARIEISANSSTYTLKRESGNVINSNGTMNYSSEGNKGFIDFNDLVGSFNGRITLTFTSELSGTYSSSASQNSRQSGSFSIIAN